MYFGRNDWFRMNLLPPFSLRRKWEDNIKMNLQELGPGVMDWIDLAQDGCKCSKGLSSSIK